MRWGLPVFIALALLVVILAAFLYELLTFDPRHQALEPVSTLTADSYLDKVAPLLANADPANGDALIVKHQCATCHREGVKNGIAPSFAGIAARAADRRPPLTAAAYLYESITHPMAYVVEGFAPAMPQDFAARLPDQDLGDIIAYLLTPDAQ